MERRVLRNRPGSIVLALSLVAGLATMGLVAAAAPASAAATISASASNGTVGVSQAVTATLSGLGGSETGTVTFLANSQSIGSAPVGGSAGSKAQVSWTPSSAASTIVEARYASSTGATASDSDTVSIAKVNTASSITTPGSAAASTKIPLIATVSSRDGSYVPTGTVTFQLNDGTVIGTGNLDGSGRASVNYTTPTTTGTVYVFASYPGDANAGASKTATSPIKVTAQSSTIVLVVPSTAYVNTSLQLAAKINPASAPGTVDFAVNGKALGSAKVNNGTANIAWLPTATGGYTITAKYSGGGGINSATATAKVTVNAQLKTDQITVDPDGAAGVWVPNSTITLTNGASVKLLTSTSSGQPVALSVVGPCALNGNVLTVRGVGGSCALTAKSNGGNGYGPATQKYTVQTGTGAQTAKILAPPTGYYKEGRSLRLSRLDAVTNVNQPIKWRVISGKSNCRIVASGLYYKVKLIDRGKCRVRGKAPAISNQWSALLVKRTYGVR
ncbi:MAG: Ig-like domain-containing protein [bacterium]|nr:Ig-like domain-containing protein [bacterium]